LVVEEEDLESNLLDFLFEHILERSFLELWHFVEDFDLTDVGEALIPFALA
jgi:hypothetical protein